MILQQGEVVYVDNGADRLLLFFNGWGADCNAVKHLTSSKYNILIIHSHHKSGVANYSESFFEKYREIVVVGWSLGVAVAYSWYHRYRDLVSCFVAINGTLAPIDDQLGLPVDNYNKTIEGWSEKGRKRFFMRMFGGGRDFANAVASGSVSERELEDQLEELLYLREEFSDFKGHADSKFYAVIGERDMIFPVENLCRFWTGEQVLLERDREMPHFPFGKYREWDELLSTSNHNTSIVAHQFSKGFQTYNSEAIVQREVCQNLISKLTENLSQESVISILEVGVGTGLLTKELVANYQPKYFDLNDLTLSTDRWISPIKSEYPNIEWQFIHGDAELLKLDREYSLIVSASTFQWFQDPRKFIANAVSHLSDGGVLAFTTYGESNFKELRSLGVKALNYRSIEEQIEMCGDDLEIVYSRSEVRVLKFATPLDVLYHLKRTGVNSFGLANVNHISPHYIVKHYPQDSNGEYSLTYEPQYIIARKRTR